MGNLTVREPTLPVAPATNTRFASSERISGLGESAVLELVEAVPCMDPVAGHRLNNNGTKFAPKF